MASFHSNGQNIVTQSIAEYGDSLSEGSDGEDTRDAGEMDNRDKEKLRLTRDRMVKNLEAGHVLDRLLQEKVISHGDVDEIMHRDNDAKQRASRLIEILPRRGARAFKAFRDSLLLCEAADYSDLVTELDRVEGGTVTNQNDDRIQVVIRVRPLTKEERQQEKGCLTVDTRLMRVSIPTSSGTVQQFDFHNVFPEETTQAEIFNTMASPIVDAVLEGYNGCILCYGKTGSGKTYTMAGPSDRDLNEKTEGIIYRALNQLFLKSKKKQDWNIAFFVSVLEIYNERVFDLTASAAKRGRRSLDIREDQSNNMFFAYNLKEHNVTDEYDAIRRFSDASLSRRTRATDANDRSSRSHMVFQVKASLLHKAGTEAGRTGELYLVDLAGSETAGDSGDTGAEGLREGANINKSLMYLKDVIRDLSIENCLDFKFRRSSLTMLLKRVLTGNSKTAFIVNVDPSQKSRKDTRRSLEFASNAKKVKVKPKINYSPLESLLTKYLKDIADLKRQIETMKKSRQKSAHGGRPASEPEKETFDVDKVRELVNYSVENTTQDFHAKLDGLLEEERRELSTQLKVLQENVQQKSELEAQQTREAVSATDKLLEEIFSKQKQVLEEQQQIRQLLTESKERTVEEQLQSSEHVKHVNTAMEAMQTSMESNLESIRKEMKDRHDNDEKNYHEELEILETNFADLKTEVNSLTLTVTTATEETKDFRAKLDGLLEKERRELSTQLINVLQENVQEKRELEAQQTSETVSATDKVLEEICSEQKQVLEEQLQIRQLLTESKERTVEEKLQRHDDTPDQTNEHVKQMTTAMEAMKTSMESHLESIRKEVKDRHDNNGKNYHKELKKLRTNFADLKTEVSDLTLAVTAATEETRAKKETVVDVETSQPKRQDRQFRGDDKPAASVSCCECCETLCAVMWYRDDSEKWYDPRGQGAGWVTLLAIFYLVCLLLIIPLVLIYIYKWGCGGSGGQSDDQPNNLTIDSFQRFWPGNRVHPSSHDNDGNPDAQES